MFSYLRALAARLARRGFGGLPPTLPDDPYIGVREPRKGGPAGRSAAVALAEPAEPTIVHAHSRERETGIN
jgi:hypothetical protein